MSEIHEPNLRVGSELAIEFGQYLLEAADYFNGEPFVESDAWQVSQSKTRESVGYITETIGFTAERNQPDDETEELDEDIEFYIGVEIHRPIAVGEFSPNHKAEDPALVFDAYYQPDENGNNLSINEFTVVSVGEIWQYTVGLNADYVRKLLRFDYLDSDDDIVASLYTMNVEGRTVLLDEDMDVDISLHKLDKQLSYAMTSIETREIAGVLKRLGYVGAYDLLPEALR